MPSERRQKKLEIVRLHLNEVCTTGKSLEGESGLVAVWGWGEKGNGEWLLMVYFGVKEML